MTGALQSCLLWACLFNVVSFSAVPAVSFLLAEAAWRHLLGPAGACARRQGSCKIAPSEALVCAAERMQR